MIAIQIWPVSIRQAAGNLPMCEVNILFWWFNDGLQIYNLYMFIFIIWEEIAEISKEGWALKNHFIWGYPPNLCTHSRQHTRPGQILKLFNSTLRQLMNSDSTLIFSLQLNYQICSLKKPAVINSGLFAFHHHDFAINIKMFKVHRMKVCLDVTKSALCQMSGHHHPVPTSQCQYSLSPAPGADHEVHHQEWDQGHPGSRDHQPGLLMIYSLHLPQAMRGTTLNEQHKPHSLMSNFSIAYFWDVYLLIYDLSLAHYRRWPHYPGVAWSDVTHHPMTRDDNLTWSQTIYQNNPGPNPGPVMKSVKTNF